LKKLEHFSEIYKSYDTFIVDLWGVMHDGIALNLDAITTIENLIASKKKVFFLSNAPRPNNKVINFLKKLKMQEKLLQNVLTSGEVAIKFLREKKFGNKFFHLGPEKDNSLYKGLEIKKTSLEMCDFILCTGLFHDYEQNLNYYKDLLKNSLSKKFICTNPDLIVHRGDTQEYCAGKIAQIFENLGGEVIYFGKPYELVYNEILNTTEKSFIIGDNLNTDIKGANNLKLDSLFITGGVHRSEFKDENDLKNLLKKHNVNCNYFQKKLIW